MEQQTQVQTQTASYQDNAKPLSMGQWLGTLLLLIIPLVNLILLFVWSFGGNTNINKRNFARAYLILSLVGIVVAIIIGSMIAAAGMAALNGMNY